MSEPGHYHDVLKDLSTQHRALRQDIPEVYTAFNELSNAALTDGALAGKVKELMAMAIGVVHGCDGCIASHARGAARAKRGTRRCVSHVAAAAPQCLVLAAIQQVCVDSWSRFDYSPMCPGFAYVCVSVCVCVSVA